MSGGERARRLGVAVVMLAPRARRLSELLASLPESVTRVVVVETAAGASAMGSAPADPRLEVVRHAAQTPPGSLLAAGIGVALRRGADVIVTLTREDRAAPEDITALLRPIAEGWADHVKISPDHAAAAGSGRYGRRLDNIGLTFLTKLCSGYWNVLDLEGGMVATRADALARVPLGKLSDRHFEADLLVHLNIIEAKVADLPLVAAAARAPAVAQRLGLSGRLLAGLGRRVFWRYLFYDVSPVATFAITGCLLSGFGLCFGGFEWAAHAARGVPTPNGTIMLAVAPLLVGFQLLLHAILLDIANTPRAAGSVLGLSVPGFAPRAYERACPSDAPPQAARSAPTTRIERVTSMLMTTAIVLTSIALADLTLRAALRLETRWDTLVYHLPFAAVRGGVPVPFDMSDLMRPIFQGFPPLPHLLQGWLWRLTGSVNATGVVNLIAFGGFIAYCQRVLRAPFWLVAPIALTAPTVVIQCSASYVDLFANSLLAAGVCSCLRLFLFPSESSRAVVIGGLLALVLAAWSKFQLVVLVALVACIFGAVMLRRAELGLSRRRMALLWGAAVLLAAAPYLKNIWFYHNPFWPIRLPVLEGIPYTKDAIAEGDLQRPPMMKHVSQFWLFVHSLFEIDHPTRYAWRPRWNIDQGNAWLAFRMGGFWGVAASIYLPLVGALLVIWRGYRGAMAALGVLGVLAFVAHLPQAHELRYYMFIPLAGACIVGMSFERLQALAPRAAAGLLALVLGLFLYMVSENRVHYLIEHVGVAAAARSLGADAYWPKLDPNRTYCAVNMAPIPFLLTGPTISEYHIVDRTEASLCPPGSEILRY